MNTETKTKTDAQENDIELTTENIATYEAAAALYRGGEKEAALDLIKEKLGEEEAKKAEAVMAEADALQAVADENAKGESTKTETETA